MKANAVSVQPPKKKRGRPKDTRPVLELRVEQDIYDQIAALQAQTGLTPDQSAALLLHILIRDPANAAARLQGLYGPPPGQRPTLVADKDLVS